MEGKAARAVVFDAGGVLMGEMPSGMFKKLADRYPEEQQDAIRYAHKGADKEPGNCYNLWQIIKTDPSYTTENYFQDFKVTGNISLPTQNVIAQLIFGSHASEGVGGGAEGIALGEC